LWCFAGEVVVNCVVNVVFWHHVFAFRKTRHVFKVYFLGFPIWDGWTMFLMMEDVCSEASSACAFLAYA